MEVVVRTPHGAADVSVREGPDAEDAPAGPTIGDVLALTTGQATPRIARVDGAIVETTALLRDVAGDGSSIETDATLPAAPPAGTRWLVAVSGPGTGRSLELEPGTYRIGPGRRLRADELAAAVVDLPAAEIELATTGDARLRPADRTLGAHVADVELDDEQPWRVDTPERPAPPLVVGDRAFVLRSQPTDGGEWVGWRRHRADSPFDVPIGIVPMRIVDGRLDDAPLGGSYGEATLDLLSHPVVAVVSEDGDSRQAMLRTIALGAARARRPLELDVAVITEPPELPAWDWAKWLPHVRDGDGVQVLADDAVIAAWLDDRRSVASQRTLLVVDAPRATASERWPLRSLIADPPDDVIVAVAVASTATAPSSTSAEIRLYSSTAAEVVGDAEQVRLLPALLDPEVAAEAARSLAREGTRERTRRTEDDRSGPDLLDLVARPSDRPWEVGIGRDAGGAVTVELTGGVIDIVSSRYGPIADVAAAIVAGACLQHPPEELWVLDAARTGEPSSLDAIRRLPHVVLSNATLSTFDRRVLARLDHVLRGDGRPQRVLILANDDEQGAATLAALGRMHDDVVVLALRRRPLHDATPGDEALDASAHTSIRLSDQVGRRVATIAVGEHAPHRFVPYEPRRPIRRGPEVAPFTAGRPLTALERRLQRLGGADSTTPPDLARVIQLIGDASTPLEDSPTIVPPPLTTELDAAALRARAPGDGVPIGLVDRPEAAGDEVWWWLPGGGSMLFVGAIRSGVRRVLRTLADGVAERCSPDELAVAAVVATSSTKRAYAALPHAVAVADRTNPDEILSLIDSLEAAVGSEPGARRLLAVIDDIGWTKATLKTDADRHRLDQVLATALRPGSPIDVVATATTIDDAGPLVNADRRAIGQLTDPDEAFRLAVPDELGASPIAGRCWLLPHGALAQLAAAGAVEQPRAATESATAETTEPT